MSHRERAARAEERSNVVDVELLGSRSRDQTGEAVFTDRCDRRVPDGRRSEDLRS